METFSYSKPRIIITGAGGGIGRACALLFAKKGYRLALFVHKNDRLLKEEMETAGFLGHQDYRLFHLDISDPEQVKAATEAALSFLGGIDLLVNNAGIAHFALDQDVSPSEWQMLIGTNLSGLTYVTRNVIPAMIAKPGGKIINISSMWGTYGASCEAAYSATKGGINAYTKALAKELAPMHIPVNAIAFGVVDTEMNARLTNEERAVLEEQIPFGRMASTDEAAQMISLLAEAPEYLTGQIIGFDGAF